MAQDPVLETEKDSVTVINGEDSLRFSGKPFFMRDSITVMPSGMVFRDDTLLRSPWGAVGRSLLIPGWGQLYNDQPLKGAIFLASDAAWIYMYRQRDRYVGKIERQRKIIDRQIKTDPYLNNERKRILEQRFRNLTARLDGALNRRNIYGWLFALSHLLGMVDAFVDAHLYGFDDKMDMAVLPSAYGCRITLRVTIK